MKLYTGKGDAGETDLLGDRINKSDPLICLLGSLDEATSAIGLARAHSRSDDVQLLLIECQRDLYRIMAELAFTDELRPAEYNFSGERVDWLESATDQLGTEVTLAPEFVLPGETIPAASADLARTVVRRAERDAVALKASGQTVNPQIIRYLNRLSSLLFIVAREAEAGDDVQARKARG